MKAEIVNFPFTFMGNHSCPILIDVEQLFTARFQQEEQPETAAIF